MQTTTIRTISVILTSLIRDYFDFDRITEFVFAYAFPKKLSNLTQIDDSLPLWFRPHYVKLFCCSAFRFLGGVSSYLKPLCQLDFLNFFIKTLKLFISWH